MTEFEQQIEELRERARQLDPRLVLNVPAGSDLEPPLFVNVAAPPVSEQELERLLAQDAG